MQQQQSYTLLENILVLKKTVLFSAVPTVVLRAVAARMEECCIRAGEPVVREGELGDSLYLIKKGRVRISKKIGASDSTDLAELTDGECFGEMAVVDEEVRSASVFAKDECILLRICREDLMDVIIEHPVIGMELLRIFVKRLRSANERIEALSKEN